MYLMHTMKDGTRILATYPAEDGSFYVYAIKAPILGNGTFFQPQGERQKILLIFCKPYEVSIAQMGLFDKNEAALLFHYVCNHVEEYSNLLKNCIKIENVMDNLSDNRILKTPAQSLLHFVKEQVQESDEMAKECRDWVNNAENHPEMKQFFEETFPQEDYDEALDEILQAF